LLSRLKILLITIMQRSNYYQNFNNNEKIQLYIERINMENNRYENITKTKWNLESTLSKVNSIYNELNKENIQSNITSYSCSICLNSTENKTTVKTKCGHTFCFECIDNNRKYNKHTGELCGICRKNIFT